MEGGLDKYDHCSPKQLTTEHLSEVLADTDEVAM